MLLQLRNFSEHPVRRNYLVFQFYNLDMAEAFHQALEAKKIPFERSDEDSIPKKVLFGVHKTYGDQAKYLNNYVIGKLRQPFVGNPYLKWTMLLIVGAAISIAFIGYLKNV